MPASVFHEGEGGAKQCLKWGWSLYLTLFSENIDDFIKKELSKIALKSLSETDFRKFLKDISPFFEKKESKNKTSESP